MKTPKYIFIHHTAVSREKNPDQWQATNAYHKGKNWGTPMKPIYTPVSSLGLYGGYNYEVSASGSVKQFRVDGEETVAQYQPFGNVKNLNDGSAISICLDGNFDIELPTEEQKKAVAKLIAQKMEQYKIPKQNVFCHRKVAPKTCPGLKLPSDIYNYFISMENNTSNEIPEWAKESAEKAKNKGVIKDWSNPNAPVSKAELAKILDNLKLLG